MALAMATMDRQRGQAKEAADRKRGRQSPLVVGDWVVLRNEAFESQYRAERKFALRWTGPYEVLSVDNHTSTYQLAELDGTTLKQWYPGKRLKLFRRRGADAYEVLEATDPGESEEEGPDDGGDDGMDVDLSDVGAMTDPGGDSEREPN